MPGRLSLRRGFAQGAAEELGLFHCFAPRVILRRGGLAGARRRAGYRGIRYVDPRYDITSRKCMCRPGELAPAVLPKPRSKEAITMPDNENKPDYAPKNYEMPKMDFSDAKLEKAPSETKT